MFSDSDGDLYFMNNGTKWYAAHAKDVTAANTGGIVAQSLGANGYVKFANGLILQWGNVRLMERSITFPIEFPNYCAGGCAMSGSRIIVITNSWNDNKSGQSFSAYNAENGIENNIYSGSVNMQYMVIGY